MLRGLSKYEALQPRQVEISLKMKVNRFEGENAAMAESDLWEAAEYCICIACCK